MPRAKTAKAKAVGGLSRWDTAINPDATKKLIAELATSSKKPWLELDIGTDKYRPNYLRIVPKHPEQENPWNIVPVHYLGAANSTRMVVCVKEAGLQGECPACIIRWDLHENGDKQGARGLRVSIRSFLNVLRLDDAGALALNADGDPDETIYILSLNQIQFLGKRQVSYDLDEEGDLPLFFFFEKLGDVSNVNRGRDLLLKAKKDKSGDFDTVAMKFSFADESPFQGTFEMLEGEGFNDLGQVVQLASAEEVMQIIEGRSPTAITPAAAVPQIEAAKASPSRFGGDSEDEEEETKAESPTQEEPAAEKAEEGTAEEAGEEEETENPRASRTAPKTNQQEAIARLRDANEKGGD